MTCQFQCLIALVLKSTSTPPRSQNILYLDDAAVVVVVGVMSLDVEVLVLREVVPKYPMSDCWCGCDFAFLDCGCEVCAFAGGGDGRLDMMTNPGMDEVEPLKQNE